MARISESKSYQIPAEGVLYHVPQRLVPYVELMRLSKPAGFFTFYFPHLYGTLYSSLLLWPPPPVTKLFGVNLLFIVGSVFVRGAACTWNDAIDAPYDRHVFRTRHRPIARGAVTPRDAYVFTLIQTILGVVLLMQLPPLCSLYALPLAVLMGFYPFAKRITDYPQAILGFSLAIGQLIGAAAVGVDPIAEVSPTATSAIACLFGANVLCAVIVDTVYSHQDLKDDVKLGLKSIAVAWQTWTISLLSVLALLQVSLLAVAGVLLELGWSYFSVSVIGTALVLGTMIRRVRLEEAASCGWWFQQSIYLTGITQASGLCLAYLARL